MKKREIIFEYDETIENWKAKTFSEVKLNFIKIFVYLGDRDEDSNQDDNREKFHFLLLIDKQVVQLLDENARYLYSVNNRFECSIDFFCRVVGLLPYFNAENLVQSSFVGRVYSCLSIEMGLSNVRIQILKPSNRLPLRKLRVWHNCLQHMEVCVYVILKFMKNILKFIFMISTV